MDAFLHYEPWWMISSSGTAYRTIFQETWQSTPHHYNTKISSSPLPIYRQIRQPDNWSKTTGSAIELLASMSPLLDITSLSHLLYLKLINMAGQFSKPSFCALTWSPVVFSFIDSSQPVVRTSLLDATLTTTRWVLNVLLTQNCNYLLFRWNAQRWWWPHFIVRTIELFHYYFRLYQG